MDTDDAAGLEALEVLIAECEATAAACVEDPEISRLVASMTRKAKLARLHHLQRMAGLRSSSPEEAAS